MLTHFIAAPAAAILIIAGSAGSAAALSPTPVQEAETEHARVPGEVIVKYAAGSERSELREQYDLEPIEPLPLRNTELVSTAAGSVTETIAALTADPDVVYAEPNYVYRATAFPNDPSFPQQWALHQSSDADVDAPQAWELSTGDPKIVVAVVDTGVAFDHPELAPNMWRNPGETGGGKESNGLDDDGNGYVDDFQGWDWIGDDRTPRDLHGHGTHVAGIVGARGNDGAGTAGVSWGSKIMPLRALDSNGEGTTAEIAAAFTYAARNGAKVVNVSLGGQGHSLSVLNAMTAAPDTLFVAAAGNAGANNDTTGSYPCNYPVPNVVCVGASDASDGLASFSNYGATTVDLAAPGTSILSLQPAFATRFAEDFAADLTSTWTTGGVNGTWTRDPAGHAVDSAGASYADNADHWLATKAPFDLRGMNDCLLRYSLNLDLEQGADSLAVEASPNGTDWSRLRAWTGSTNGAWTRVTDALFAHDGQASVHLRFRLLSNSSTTADGAAVDNVSVRCNATTYSGSEVLYAGGTSMAAPHVAGTAALAWSARSDATVAAVAKALADGADARSALFGKTVSGGRLNACRTIVLLTGADAAACSDAAAAPPPTASPTPSPTATPSPTPASTPSPTATPTTSASPTPAGTPSPTPSPDPTPTPTPEATPAPTPAPSSSPSPSPQPEPQPQAGAPAEPAEGIHVHDRIVSLRLRGELVARGRVAVIGGFEGCSAGVPVKILRKGEVVAKGNTRPSGRFRIEVPNEAGRYVARAPQVARADGHSCLSARSRTRTA